MKTIWISFLILMRAPLAYGTMNELKEDISFKVSLDKTTYFVGEVPWFELLIKNNGTGKINVSLPQLTGMAFQLYNEAGNIEVPCLRQHALYTGNPCMTLEAGQEYVEALELGCGEQYRSIPGYFLRPGKYRLEVSYAMPCNNTTQIARENVLFTVVEPTGNESIVFQEMKKLFDEPISKLSNPSYTRKLYELFSKNPNSEYLDEIYNRFSVQAPTAWPSDIPSFESVVASAAKKFEAELFAIKILSDLLIVSQTQAKQKGVEVKVAATATLNSLIESRVESRLARYANAYKRVEMSRKGQ